MPRLQAITSKKIWRCAELACLLFLACLLLGKGVLPGWRSLNSDFPNYYLVARLLREGFNLDRIYDWVWLQRIKDHWGLDQPLVAFAGLTPLSALPIWPVAGFAALTAKRFWIVANLIFLFGTAETLHRVTQLGRHRIWILCLLAVIPLRASFLLGQMHILVLLLLALAYFFRSRMQGFACGVCVALAGALKVYPLLFIFYFAWKRQWREAISTVLATAALVGIGYACMGSHIMHIYLTQILPRSMQGEVIDPYNVRAASAAALLHRLFLFEPGLNPAPLWNRPLLYSIFYPLWQAAVLFPLFLCIRPLSRDSDREKLEWAVFLLALLMLSPVPSSYHFVVMILPVVLAADVFVKRQQHSRVGVMLLLYFMMCGMVISSARVSSGFGLFTVLAFSRLWIGLLLWLFLLVCLWREDDSAERHKGLQVRAVLLAVILAIFWIVGFTGYQRHFAHLEDDIHARLQMPVHLLLATDIHRRANGFVSTVIAVSSYQIADQNGKAVWPSTEAGTDQLSSVAVANRSPVFVEVANKNGSHIALQDAPSFHIPNGESPAISADGLSLAYIREVKGRGRLRMAHLASPSDAITVADNAEIVDGPYDVRDVAFAPSGDLIFAARIAGATNIYRIAPGGPLAVLVAGREEADAPDVSPNGQRIVFRRLLRNRWQLVMMSLDSHQETQLTFGDCNAFSPAWMNDTTIAYATDCGRGLGLTALASIDVSGRAP